MTQSVPVDPLAQLLEHPDLTHEGKKLVRMLMRHMDALDKGQQRGSLPNWPIVTYAMSPFGAIQLTNCNDPDMLTEIAMLMMHAAAVMSGKDTAGTHKLDIDMRRNRRRLDS